MHLTSAFFSSKTSTTKPKPETEINVLKESRSEANGKNASKDDIEVTEMSPFKAETAASSKRQREKSPIKSSRNKKEESLPSPAKRNEEKENSEKKVSADSKFLFFVYFIFYFALLPLLRYESCGDY